MQHTISTPTQARALLRGLRLARGLSQAQLGELLGVNQKRIARIEADPAITSLDQIVRAVVALGGRVLIDDGSDLHALTTSAPAPAKTARRRPPDRRRPSSDKPTW